MINKEQLRGVSSNSGVSGVDLMRKINEGSVVKAPSEHIEAVRTQVVEACDELLEVGARIRPLMVGEEQIGWVRGIYGTERRRLSRWVSSNEYITSVLLLATTLSRSEIYNLNMIELQNLIQLVQKMTEYDLSLFPYLSAFCTTLVSENLWHGRGTNLTSFENRVVELPDGRSMKIITPSDHSRLWASLCVYREQAKVRMDASWNAILQVRPLAGKSVEPLVSELKAVSRQLITNSNEPWETIVKVRPKINLDDGWAHSENMETREGMMKELHGMLDNDKHEQLMVKFEKEQIAAAEARNRAIEAISQRRGGPGIHTEGFVVESEVDIRKRELELKKGRVPPPPIDRNKTETVGNPVERIKRYQ